MREDLDIQARYKRSLGYCTGTNKIAVRRGKSRNDIAILQTDGSHAGKNGSACWYCGKQQIKHPLSRFLQWKQQQKIDLQQIVEVFYGDQDAARKDQSFPV